MKRAATEIAVSERAGTLRVSHPRANRGEGLVIASLVLLLVALAAAVMAFTILTHRPANAQGGMVGPCFTAWEVLLGDPPADFDAGMKPPTEWSKPCRTAAHQIWLEARPWALAAPAAAVAAVFAWLGRRRLLKREANAPTSTDHRKTEVE